MIIQGDTTQHMSLTSFSNFKIQLKGWMDAQFNQAWKINFESRERTTLHSFSLRLGFVPLGFPDKVFNEAVRDVHPRGSVIILLLSDMDVHG